MAGAGSRADDESHLFSRPFDLHVLRMRGDAVLRQMGAAARVEHSNTYCAEKDVRAPTPSLRLAQILSWYALPSPSAKPLGEPVAPTLTKKKKKSMRSLPDAEKLTNRRQIPYVSLKMKSGKPEQSFSHHNVRAAICFSSPQHA
eukprot:TRINITY_DN8495_c0_g1_i2.p1 TRINITY_DN8495_c0_g1~~TRINITY_DN8495_c0_g1_i2.p1  ORF type:complete len:144 (+),score=14.08 TRINITY_DN8495_c0_g1_i2:61-492(+)